MDSATQATTQPTHQKKSVSESMLQVVMSKKLLVLDDSWIITGIHETERRTLLGEIIKFIVVEKRNSKEVILLKLSAQKEKEQIVQLGIYLIAHLGVYAFLLQVFQDYGIISKVLFYYQLACLIMLILYYTILIIDEERTKHKAPGMLISSKYWSPLQAFAIVDHCNLFETLDYPITNIDDDEIYRFKFTKEFTTKILVCVSCLVLELLTLEYFRRNAVEIKSVITQ